MSFPLKVVIAVVVVVAASLLLWRFVFGPPAGEEQTIRVSGNIEVTEAQVAFKLAGRVQERLVDEGVLVHKDQVIARLEGADLLADRVTRLGELQAAEAALAELLAGSRPEEIAAAKAALGKAEWALKELLAGSRKQQIASAQANLQSAAADRDRAMSDYERARRLIASKTIAPEEYDRASAAYAVAVEKARDAAQQLSLVQEGPRSEDIDQARAVRDQAKAQYDLVKAGPRREDIDQARAKVEQAKGIVGLAQARVSYMTVYSPLTGIVLSKNIEPGEYVAPGTPVVTVGDLVNVWLRAYIDEADLGRVKFGQKARVTTDTYPGRVYPGTVSFISQEAEFTPKNVQTAKERVKLVYRIKIDIQNPKMELKAGMPADARIDW
jgi:HlyD family secretion protein